MSDGPPGKIRGIVWIVLGAVVAVAVVAYAVFTATRPAPAAFQSPAKNVIYLLGDGMGRTHVT
ncbi:MAG: hypothetical protein C0488_04790, partial [Arthrobacter sp.]|nr:hypothetical protein [Arthrobacter sp.]